MRIPVDTPTGYMNVLCRLNLAGVPTVAYEPRKDIINMYM